MIKFRDLAVGDVFERNGTQFIKLTNSIDCSVAEMPEQHLNCYNLNKGHYSVAHPNFKYKFHKRLYKFI